MGIQSSISLKAIYQIIKFAVDEKKNIAKITVIGDSKWLKMIVKLDDVVFSWTDRYFNKSLFRLVYKPKQKRKYRGSSTTAARAQGETSSYSKSLLQFSLNK